MAYFNDPPNRGETKFLPRLPIHMHLGTCEKMISFDPYEHFTINRILLLTIGLWPYQRTKLVQFQWILFSIILISFVAFQLTTFLTEECTPNLVIKILSSTIFFFMYIVEYNCFWANGQTIRYLIEELKRICDELKDENEIAIIKKYGNDAQFFTVALTWFTAGWICIMFCLPIGARILDIVLSANESRVFRTSYIMTEYFVDSERYFYLILLHMDASCCIGSIVVSATGTTFITYIKHACGMFKIASYRIEQALSNGIARNIRSKTEIRINKEIIYAVDIHRKAMKYSEYLVSNFEGMFVFLIVFGVMCLSLNLFRILQMMTFGGTTNEFLFHINYIFVIFIYMFLTNYLGQEVTDHNNHVFMTAYNVQWYVAPLHTQRMILFLLQRGSRTFTLNVGRLITGSLENFASLISASVSYCTLIYSTQQ